MRHFTLEPRLRFLCTGDHTLVCLEMSLPPRPCTLFVHLASSPFRAASNRSAALVLREGRAARKVPIVKEFLAWLEGRRKAGEPAPGKSVDNETQEG